jgi:hypothetical protein
LLVLLALALVVVPREHGYGTGLRDAIARDSAA